MNDLIFYYYLFHMCTGVAVINIQILFDFFHDCLDLHTSPVKHTEYEWQQVYCYLSTTVTCI